MVKHFIDSARRTIRIEAKEIAALEARVGEAFARACELLLKRSGRIVVTGVGKSGHIANKIAATLASTGSPAFFMHAGEASHGDLGMLTADDAVIAISGSGSTAELLALLPMIKRIGTPLITFTGDPASALAKAADVNLDVSITEEACPLGLAPTSSTSATLVMGDALAVALLEARGFTAEDFAFSHPGGTLGKRLLLKVSDVMQQDFPSVAPDALLGEALLEISSKGLGMTTILESGELAGLFTDGDLRRCVDQRVDVHNTRISEVMTRGGQTISSKRLAAEALKIMQDKTITSLVVVDDSNKPCGVVHLHALIRAGLA
ncbi:MAG: KpsF/GutQ family sugar-phosphate isomerase [Gammaproteobacteria bacterium]|nr:KpsF/GutQ family sugar-phosphate isomerase [Gammaproteobacteria bacterium]NND40378.1 KpsF/GutQ family sugar-phosphate isomerase [Pseudomonadales bacterium]NNL10408.1 KpsF/GutQ family sugar-phosphate isomerase [Pseudomonadales bacterium]NNM12559.1 KpsF/GutQ family sugar-phosphate isomerase [Pseudomonadales bacterium]RZV56468.1 MAG: KpsF/GutQ family sugar-phosphate isomerase [Pseudomonadales bacterium]